MEKALFDWDGFDQIDTFVFLFMDCVPKVQLGPFVAGQMVNSISIDFEKGEIHIYDGKEEPSWSGKVGLVLVPA
jgi:hypothetical protein